MTTKLWIGDKRSQAATIIKKLLTLLRENGLEFSFDCLLLRRALMAWSKYPLSEPSIYQVLKTMKKERVSGCEAFERIWSSLRQLKPVKSKRHWTFLVPMYVQPEQLSLPIRVSIQRHYFRFDSFERLRKEIGHEKFDLAIKRGTGYRKLRSTKIVLVSRSTGNSFEAAWDGLEPVFDLFRGVLEFSWGYGTLHYSSAQYPRRKFGHPEWLLGYSASQCEVRQFLIDADSSSTPQKITQKEIEIFSTDLKRLRAAKSDSSIWAIIARAMRLYPQAVDARFNHHALLAYWQIAELVTMSEEKGGEMKTVSKRLAWFGELWKKKPAGLEDILLRIGEKRNEIVHRGLHGRVNEDDVNILKICCETSISWLVESADKLSTASHLGEFFSLRTKNHAHLKVVRDAVKFVERSRSK